VVLNLTQNRTKITDSQRGLLEAVLYLHTRVSELAVVTRQVYFLQQRVHILKRWVLERRCDVLVLVVYIPFQNFCLSSLCYAAQLTS